MKSIHNIYKIIETKLKTYIYIYKKNVNHLPQKFQ